jgi:hypothetical protein
MRVLLNHREVFLISSLHTYVTPSLVKYLQRGIDKITWTETSSFCFIAQLDLLERAAVIMLLEKALNWGLPIKEWVELGCLIAKLHDTSPGTPWL